MPRPLDLVLLSMFVLSLMPATIAQTSSRKTTTSCDFTPDAQVAVEYQQVEFPNAKKALGHEVSYGKVWAPGGKPLALFANTPVTVGGERLADGAYTMFVIPDEKSWTLVVSKGTAMNGNYDPAQDLARVPMQYGQLLQAESAFTAYFAHTAPDECNLRLDLGKARAWVVFRRQ